MALAPKLVWCALVAGVVASWLAVTASEAALSPYRKSTPWLGWESWGACYDACDEETVLANTRIIRESGLLKLGYDTIIVDDNWQKLHNTGWLARERAFQGPLRNGGDPGCPVHDPTFYPRGMQALGKSINELGFHYGLYMSGGDGSCIAGRRGINKISTPSIPRIDGPCLMNWNITVLKVDRCGASSKAQIIKTLQAFRKHLSEKVAIYNSRMMCMVSTPCREKGLLKQGLSAKRRAQLQEQCRFHQPTKAPKYENYCRTTSDVHRISSDATPTWDSVLDRVGLMTKHNRVSKPGFWADPDYMLFDVTDDFGPREHRSQFHLWAVMSAPLLIGSDLRVTGDHAIPIVSNRAAIAINQIYERDAGGRDFFVGNCGWGFLKKFSYSNRFALVVVNTGYIIDKTGKPNIKKVSRVLKYQPDLKRIRNQTTWRELGCTRIEMIDDAVLAWSMDDDESMYETMYRGSVWTVVGENFPIFILEPRSSVFYTIAPTPCPTWFATKSPTP